MAYKKDRTGENENRSGIRLNKYLSDAGVCSRREADRLIEEGQVTVDGEKALTGMRVTDQNHILVRGKPVKRDDHLILIAFNKPRGIVCTSDTKREKNNIIDYIGYPERIYPIGRLDKDSEGLILLTNDGSLVNQIMKARTYHEKEYIVTVNRDFDEDFIRGMSGGVPILDTVTRRCKVEKIDNRTFRIILTQGLNRQIRRMCAYFGYDVVRLKRVRIMNIRLGKLKEGTYRQVTADELKALRSE